MEKITVAELAAECSVQNQVVLGELKRLGLYVFSPSATIDLSFAETIRKKIQAARDAEAARIAEEEKERQEAAKKAEKKAAKAAKKAAAKPEAAAPPAPAVEEAPAPPAKKARKAAAKPGKAKIQEPPKVEEVLPKPSLAPRKGRKHFDRATSELVEVVLPHVVEVPRVEEVPEVAASAPAVVEAPPPPAPEREVVSPEAPPEMLEPVPAPVEEAAAPPAPAVEVQPEPARGPEAIGLPGTVPRKIVLPKAKTKVLMRTSAEKVVTPDATDRILRGLREDRAGLMRPLGPTRIIRRKKVGKAEPAVERVARVIEMPRAPIRPEDFKPISITEGVTLKELAEKMDVKSKFIIAKLLAKGIVASVNQALDVDVAKEICAEFGYRADVITFEQEAELKQEIQDRPEDYVPRPPVVTVMGHVDHGKTSLLDAIRETNVTAAEAGGITQHIGAYSVSVNGRSITFLDTPGHEAFPLMRARGAQATDIVVLVVAADDGVMPQTIEAMHHARAAGVPIVVAINKIDKPGAQIERVKQALADQGLLAEDWGGDVVTVPVSAKMKTNIDLLLEMILLVADMKDFKANPKRLASGVVLEAKLDRGRGCVATVLVQNGMLRVGEAFVAGAVSGRVRALLNERGDHLESAGPSVPVEIQGLQDLPRAGDTFQVFEDAAKARQVAEYRQAKLRERSLQPTARVSLQALYQQMQEGKVKELPLILKCDVQGSVEVLADVLNKLSTEKVKVRILHSGAGAVTETDVLLASASNAIIIGFNVRPERKAQELAAVEGVEIRHYTVIYNVANDIKNAMIGLLEYKTQEKYLGRAEVRDTFRVPKYGFVAGSHVVDGIIRRNAEVRLLRDNVVVHEGKIASLRRFKDDVAEVKSGFECGIGFEGFSDVKVGDIIEAYTIERIQPTSLV
ncbi:MAG: translation initiation factor IF-2 [Acidobacteria bacterium]|nr:translation initiation factor IF-2 [Acidobacteriota bacterium]